MSLGDIQIQDIADYMGHHEKTHLEHYRQPNASRNILRISTFLEKAVGRIAMIEKTLIQVVLVHFCKRRIQVFNIIFLNFDINLFLNEFCSVIFFINNIKLKTDNDDVEFCYLNIYF